MTVKTEIKSGLKYGWDLGENNWNVDMDNNILSIGRFGFHLSVKDRDLSTAPSAPSDGDAYIVGSAPTLLWDSQAGSVAIWNDADSVWAFRAPSIGWLAYIEDEEKLSVYKSAGWSTGIDI